MSIQITEAFVNQYASNFQILAQQKASRLEACCDVDGNIVGASKSVERIGSSEAYQLTNRHADTVYVNTPHSKRWLDLTDWAWADLVDELDKIKMLADPTSPYVATAVSALNRAKDDRIIAALGGAARTTAGTTALPAGQKIVHGSVGLTIAKLITAKQLLDEAEVDEEEERCIVVTAEQISDLLNTTEVKSADYNTVKALVRGEINTFLGFKFMRSERLLKSSTTRYTYAWAKTGVRLGIGKDINSSIDKLPSKNMSVQVYARMSLGAVRTEEARVVEIACTEAA